VLLLKLYLNLKNELTIVYKFQTQCRDKTNLNIMNKKDKKLFFIPYFITIFTILKALIPKTKKNIKLSYNL
jgi:hypothetical protein